MKAGTPLPVDLSCGGKRTEGYCTPKADKQPQVVFVPPKRVLPIVFLPGIMGSNLRMSAARQELLKKSNNIAWRPDDKPSALAMSYASPATRQLQLDPEATEVDVYDPVANPIGNPKETADDRHGNVQIDIETPLLMDDPPTNPKRKTKDQKARERGWGEVFFGSYQTLLEMCELRLNSAFYGGNLDPWWNRIVNVRPHAWQAHEQPVLQPLTEAELKDALKGCLFPVHAMGYNWLRSNRKSGTDTAKRIAALIEHYKQQGRQCEKVIVVTHSMGGLVARALIHPEMGNINDKVLGVVHGVMPAIGAAATYKRMRCGFEGGVFSIPAKVLGNTGKKVTAVLANSQGGLELLPSQAYGNEWLEIRHDSSPTKKLPQKGDPYEEIYKIKGKWYGLLRRDWINPAKLQINFIARTMGYLDGAKAFHNAVVDTYHEQSYCHYGADIQRPAWHKVAWKIDTQKKIEDLEILKLMEDSEQGRLRLFDPQAQIHAAKGGYDTDLLPAGEPGDQTVPLHSAEHQLQSGKFKGVFRQTGYEHQASYQDERALHSTLYSLVRIAQTMKWSQT